MSHPTSSSRRAFCARQAMVKVAALALALSSAAHAAIPPGAIVVGAASAACPSPAYATISAAVAAAAANATIYVCAGLYPEAVGIDKPLTLLGVQHGVVATTGRTDASAETVIQAASGNDITYGGSAGTGTLDGFTLLGNGAAAGDNDGILAVNGATGFTWVNNIITATTTGINFFASGATPTLISGNRITANDEAGGSQGSNGIFFTNGAANNVTITGNAFGYQGVDINTTGSTDISKLSTGLVISYNTSVNSSNFVALFLTDGARIEGNTAGWTNPADSNAGSAIAILGGDLNTVVSGNIVDGGAANGIRIDNAYYLALPSSGITVSGNTVSNRTNGIHVYGSAPLDATSSITGNRVIDAGVGQIPDSAIGHGIWLESGLAVVVSGNRAQGSTQFDCRDDTTGTASAGTANAWTNDIGATSSPAGLCRRAPPPLAATPVPMNAPWMLLLATLLLGAGAARRLGCWPSRLG